MLNKQVFHKVLGKGTITNKELIGENKVYITVDFSDRRAIFLFPDAFKSFLTTEDKEINSIVENATNEQKKQLEKEEKSKITNPATSLSSLQSPKVNSDEIYKKRTVYSQTNAEFLNTQFGTKYEKWYKSTWEYSYNIVVWMGFVDGKERENWINYWTDKSCSIMIEKYNGIDGSIASRAINHPYRIIVEKDFSSSRHEYSVHGLFKHDENDSTIYKHVWRKIV